MLPKKAPLVRGIHSLISVSLLTAVVACSSSSGDSENSTDSKNRTAACGQITFEGCGVCHLERCNCDPKDEEDAICRRLATEAGCTGVDGPLFFLEKPEC